VGIGKNYAMRNLTDYITLVIMLESLNQDNEEMNMQLV
jgi:hypothetical protein